MLRFFIPLVFLFPDALNAQEAHELSPSKFESLVLDVLEKTEEFVLAQKIAAELRVNVALYGGSSRDLTFWVRQELKRLSKQGARDPVAELRKRQRFYLVEMLGTRRSDIDLIATGKEEELAQRLTHARPPNGEFFRWEVQPLSKLNNEVERTLGRITLDKILLSPTALRLPARVKAWHGEGLRDAQQGIVRYVRSPRYFSSPQYLSGQHDEIFEVMRTLRMMTGYEDVKATPKTIENMVAVLSEARSRLPRIKDNNQTDPFRTRFHMNVLKMFEQSVDPIQTHAWAKKLGLPALVKEVGGEKVWAIAEFQAPPWSGRLLTAMWIQEGDASRSRFTNRLRRCSIMRHRIRERWTTSLTMDLYLQESNAQWGQVSISKCVRVRMVTSNLPPGWNWTPGTSEWWMSLKERGRSFGKTLIEKVEGTRNSLRENIISTLSFMMTGGDTLSLRMDGPSLALIWKRASIPCEDLSHGDLFEIS